MRADARLATRRGSNDLFIDSSSVKSSQGLIHNNASPGRSITREEVLPGLTSIRKPLLISGSPYNTTWISNSTIRNGLLPSVAPSQDVTTTVNEFLTATRTATVPPDACCFVVQDTINVRYWARKHIFSFATYPRLKGFQTTIPRLYPTTLKQLNTSHPTPIMLTP